MTDLSTIPSEIASDPVRVRKLIRDGQWSGSTRGVALGYLQCGVVILPQAEAFDFLVFCTRNPKPLPLLEVTEPGVPIAPMFAPEADLRSDVPRYHIYRDGVLDDERTDISALWRDDFVAIILGCSLTFDSALLANGLPYRQLEETGKPTMYRTSIECKRSARYSGRLVVSMRPMLPEQAIRAVQVSSRFPWTHGAPIHIGDSAALGISDINKPDIGVPVSFRHGEVPVFWACIATIWEVAKQSKPSLFISHAPGCMFITDRKDESVSVL
jgi:uncharacterized protein YcsI (UPF0317 family)